GTANMVFNDLEGRSVHECVHVAMVDGENQILKFWIAFEGENLQSHLFALVKVDVTGVRFVTLIIGKFFDDLLRLCSSEGLFSSRLALKHHGSKLIRDKSV